MPDTSTKPPSPPLLPPLALTVPWKRVSPSAHTITFPPSPASVASARIAAVAEPAHALVRDRHRSREFIELLRHLDAAYPKGTAIKLILDNHSAHISKETTAWLDSRPAGRFAFTFTPKHGSWLNLIEGFFSKFARSVLRHIRVTSKHELKERIMAGIQEVNRHPVIHTWSYKLAEAA